jgi:drug/metabolite transporter (DMT)-like permease
VDKRLAAFIAIVITIAWATSFIIGAFNPDYNPPPSIHPLMLIVAGAAFGTAVLPKRRRDQGDDEQRDYRD